MGGSKRVGVDARRKGDGESFDALLEELTTSRAFDVYEHVAYCSEWKR